MAQRERRLGAREPVDSVSVGWRIDRHRPKRFGRRAVNDTGQMLDVSISGAGIVAPAEDDLDIGSRVLISIDGGPGIVVIQRIVPTDDPTRLRYGVAFGELSPRAANAVNELLASRRPENLDEVWSRAR